MLQYWVSEGQFYTGGFVLRSFIELVTFAHCVLTSLHWNSLSRLRLCVDVIVLDFIELVMFVC